MRVFGNKSLLVFLVFFVCFIAGCIGSLGSDLLEKAENYEEQGQFNEALDNYLKVVKTDRSKAVYAAQKAARIAQYETTEYDKALRALDFILVNSKKPKERIEAQREKAEIYFSGMANYAKAIEELNKLVLTDKQPEALRKNKFKIAKSYFFMNKFDQAIIEIDEILKNKDIDAETLFQLMHFKGNTLLTVKKIDEAISLFQKLLKDFPERSKKENVKLSLVVSLEEKERFDEAIDLLESLRGEEDHRNFIDLRIKKLKKRKENLPKGKVR